MSYDLHLLDEPIKLDNEDKLERTKIADAIADRVIRYKSEESITVGIEGSWGSGKTSIINLVRNRINKDYQSNAWEKYDLCQNSSSSKIKPLILDFNPWIYSSEEKLLSDFFRLVGNAIALRNKYSAIIFWFFTSRDIRRILETSKLGVVTSALSAIAALVVNVFNILKLGLDNRKSYAGKILSEFDEKIFVVIDDIDRLDVDETILIFKLTKIVANFPNMVFILAYDKNKTIKKINAKFEGNSIYKVMHYYKGDSNNGAAHNYESDTIFDGAHEYEGVGDNFIDKIVQYPFHIPKTHIFNYKKYFSELIETISEYSNIEVENKNTWESIYSKYLYPLSDTPRNAKQYINNIRIRLNIIDIREINLSDFLLIEVVRMYAIDAYNFLYDNILELVHDESILGRTKSRNETFHDNLLKNICDKASASNKKIIGNILSHLFPFDAGQYEYSLRICSKYHYDKYFTMSLDATNISEAEIEILKNKLYEGIDEFVEYANKFKGFHYHKIEIACEKIINKIDNDDDARFTSLLSSLWVLSENGVWHLDDLGSYACNAAYRILKKLDYASRKKALLYAIGNANITYLHLKFFLLLADPQKENGQEELLSIDDIDELHSISIEKLEKEYQIKKSLAKMGDINLILSFIKIFTPKENYDIYLERLFEDENSLLLFLGSFCSYGMAPFIQGHFEKFIEEGHVKELNEAVSKIDRNKLSEDHQKILNYYDEYKK